jgi:hypothetical protein
MFRRLALAGFMAASLLAVAAAPTVAALHPQPVSIVSTMTMGDPSNYGDFRTSGSNLICRSGQVSDTGMAIPWVRELPNGDTQAELIVDKTFTCNSGGEILVRLDVHVLLVVDSQGNIAWHEHFTWAILGGTGAYADLRGRGAGVTDATNWPETMVNYYHGVIGD